MKLVQRGLAAAGVVLAMAGCAASPDSIKPLATNSAQFAYLNCYQLASYRLTLTNAYNAAAASEENARSMDAAQLFTLGFPIGSMTHESVPYQVAELKGRIVAIETLQYQHRCPVARSAAN